MAINTHLYLVHLASQNWDGQALVINPTPSKLEPVILQPVQLPLEKQEEALIKIYSTFESLGFLWLKPKMVDTAHEVIGKSWKKASEIVDITERFKACTVCHKMERLFEKKTRTKLEFSKEIADCLSNRPIQFSNGPQLFLRDFMFQKLCSDSEYFRATTKSGFKEQDNSNAPLIIDHKHIDSDLFKLIVEILYPQFSKKPSDHKSCDENTWLHLQIAAEYLQIPSLLTYCDEWMESYDLSFDTENDVSFNRILKFLHYASEYQLGPLRTKCESRLTLSLIQCSENKKEFHEKLKALVYKYGPFNSTKELNFRLANPDHVWAPKEFHSSPKDKYRGYELADEDLKLIVQLFPQLTSLTITYGNNLTEQGIAHLVQLPLTNLSIFCFNGLTQEGFKNLSTMHLKTLELVGPALLSDDWLTALPSTIEQLSLQDLMLTDSCVQHLSLLPKLKNVSIIDCKVTPQALMDLQAILRKRHNLPDPVCTIL